MLQLLIGVLCLCLSGVLRWYRNPHPNCTDSCDHCKDFTSTSADIPPGGGDPIPEGRPDRRECRKHTCKQYGSEFNRRKQLWLHLNADHNGSSMRCYCPQCPRTYVSKGGLNRHVNLIHEKLSRYQCETCGKGVTDLTRYLDHITTHSGVKRHSCPICHVHFTQKGSLKRHVFCVHPNEAAAFNTR